MKIKRASVQSSRIKNLLRLLFSISLLLVAVLIFINRQYLLDHYTVLQYKPTQEIAAIAEKTSLSERGEFLFYATRPELLERDPFNNACRSVATEHAAILGCYSANRIYLFDIQDDRLNGIKEVTAAHEMLHAAYQRLSLDEKDRINELLASQDLGEDTDRINELMVEYAKTEPGEEYNELHSMIGSEVDTLNPELEAYYSQYFDDRSSLVSMSDMYQSVFDELKSRQDNLVTELNELADSVDTRSAQYRRNLQVLDTDITNFNKAASSGTLTRQEYEIQRSDLERRQNSLRNDYDEIQIIIGLYEQKRSELEAINSESTALNRSINSSLNPLGETIDE